MSVRGHEATQRWFQAPDQERNWKTLRWKCFLSNCGNETWPSKRAYSGLRLLFLKNLLRLYSCGYVTLQGHTRNLYVELFQEPKQKKCKMRVVQFQWNICRCAFFSWCESQFTCLWRGKHHARTDIQPLFKFHHTHYWPGVKGVSLDSGRRTEVVQQGDGRGKKKSEDGSLKKEFNSFITI